jgi:hypothetical protein
LDEINIFSSGRIHYVNVQEAWKNVTFKTCALNFMILKCSAIHYIWEIPWLEVLQKYLYKSQVTGAVLNLCFRTEHHDLCSQAEDLWRMCSEDSPRDGQELWHRRVTSGSSARGCQEGLADDLELKLND